jgi:hypothetical protein
MEEILRARTPGDYDCPVNPAGVLFHATNQRSGAPADRGARNDSKRGRDMVAMVGRFYIGASAKSWQKFWPVF